MHQREMMDFRGCPIEVPASLRRVHEKVDGARGVREHLSVARGNSRRMQIAAGRPPCQVFPGAVNT